jgi:hypothetical protein
MGFNLLDRMVSLHGGGTANDTVKILPIPAKTVTVREERHLVLETGKFTSHMIYRAVRVHGTLLV